jgi:hypothetical protein
MKVTTTPGAVAMLMSTEILPKSIYLVVDILAPWPGVPYPTLVNDRVAPLGPNTTFAAP